MVVVAVPSQLSQALAQRAKFCNLVFDLLYVLVYQGFHLGARPMAVAPQIEKTADFLQ